MVFCDLRGFTAFTETTEPEEAMNVLREYHAALGELIFKYEGTLDRYAGDGVMILFNAPIQFEDHTARAVRMAVEMRDTIGPLTEQLAQPRPQSRLRHRHRARLRDARPGRLRAAAGIRRDRQRHQPRLPPLREAKANQIVVSRRVYGMVEPWVEGKPIDDLNLKGFNHPILAAEILHWREDGRQRGGCGVGAAEEDAVADLVGWAKAKRAHHAASRPGEMVGTLRFAHPHMRAFSQACQRGLGVYLLRLSSGGARSHA